MNTPTVSVFLCSMMALISAAAVTASSCPKGWHLEENNCFHYHSEAKIFHKAYMYCLKHRSNLVTVPDSKAAHSLHSLAKGADVWIGGFHSEKHPEWTWTTFKTIKESHEFCSKDKEHNCLQLTFKGKKGGCLQPTKCLTKLPFVCHKRPSTHPLKKDSIKGLLHSLFPKTRVGA